MAKELTSYEEVKVIPTAKLSASQERALTGGQTTKWQAGEYVALPMSHFSVETEFDGTKYSSPRVLLFKKEGEKIAYVRAWKTRHFTESGFNMDVIGSTVDTEVRDGHRRIKRGQDALKGQMIRACGDALPLRVTDGVLRIMNPFIMRIQPAIPVLQAQYEGDQKSGYDVKVGSDGNVDFAITALIPFAVTDTVVSDEVIAECKAVLAKDSCLKGVPLEC